MKCINFSHSRSSSFLMTSASNHVLGTCTADTWTRVPRKRMRLEMQPIFCSLTKVLMDASVTPWVSIFCSWQKFRNNRGCIATVSLHWQREVGTCCQRLTLPWTQEEHKKVKCWLRCNLNSKLCCLITLYFC